ncbi:MAG TPA: RNA-binding protein [Beijerinckiaceae bacterium]|jgi:predicted RNA-binding protein YlxR (DUF448 family)
MPRREPERTCIVTRETRGPGEMIRFVLSPEGEVVPDLRHKLPGRGAWVTATAEAVSTAVRKRLFSRAFKTEARAAPDLPQRLEALLLSDLRQALALANKAGCVVTGFGKVEDAIASGEARALIHAVEAQPDGRRKLAQALRKRLGDAIWSVPVIDALSHDELGLALGRSHVIHAALVAGAGSDGFLTRWRLLSAYRGTPTGQQADAVGTAVSEQDPAGLPRGAGANDET